MSLTSIVDNFTSAPETEENGSGLFPLRLQNETSALGDIEQWISASWSVGNGTSVVKGDIYSSEVERLLSLLFVGLSTVFTLCAQLLVMVTIIKPPNLHNAHYYLLGVSTLPWCPSLGRSLSHALAMEVYHSRHANF